MTGKDEWRLIHAGPGGLFTDSLTQKPTQQPQQNKDSMITSVSDMVASSNSDSQQQQAVVSMVPRRRASEGVQGPPGADNPANPDLGQTARPTSRRSFRRPIPASLGNPERCPASNPASPGNPECPFPASPARQANPA